MDLDLDDAASFKRLGNHFADLGAKEAVKMHPTLPPGKCKELDDRFSVARTVCKLATKNASMVQA